MAPPIRDVDTAEPVPAPLNGYAARSERPPLLSFAALTILFNGLLAGALVVAKRRKAIPDKVESGDMLLVGVASHKVSRLLAKDKATSPLRAPFTEFEKKAGPSE